VASATQFRRRSRQWTTRPGSGRPSLLFEPTLPLSVLTPLPPTSAHRRAAEGFLKLSKRKIGQQGRLSRGTPTPPGYGYHTRHLCTRQLTLGEAVQIADRRVLVLEMRKKHGSVPKTHTRSGPDSRNEQKHRHLRCHYKRNPGSASASTDNPTRLGGLRSNRRPTIGSPSPAPAAATTTTSAPGGRTAAAMTSGQMLLP
jgi:hypothetical protein